MDTKDNTQGAANGSDPQSVSGDDLQRIAQDFAQSNTTSAKTQDQAEQTSQLEQEILSAFGTGENSFNQAVESLGDAGADNSQQEELMDLSAADDPQNLVSDAVNSSSDLSDQEEVPNMDSQAADFKTNQKPTADDFPYPSVPSKKDPTTPQGPDLAQLKAEEAARTSEKPALDSTSGAQSSASLINTQEQTQNTVSPAASSQPSETPVVPTTQEAVSTPKAAETSLATNEVEDLQAQIAQDFSQTQSPPAELGAQAPISNQGTQEAQDTSDLGVSKTYYSDLSTAMSGNEPTTMSELLQKSAFEKKEKAVLSPTSKKNIMYIAGALLLMIISVVTWFVIFGGDDDVEFITEQRVKSLVYSDEDLGINTTGLETFQTKAAIRKVLEREPESDTLSQIYYVQEDQFENLRRMGVKDIFDATDNQTPGLLYDNIENEFMHGVYTTDKSYPFIILKALSYDRAFEGMRQWEPTMIDDLATYFDLPPEATDRSLREDGFSDDLIKNKNVRVARFIPREADRRGILDFLRSDGSEFQPGQETPLSQMQESELGPDSPSPFGEVDNDIFQNQQQEQSVSMRVFDFLKSPWKTKRALAQGNSIGGTFLSDTLNNPQSATTNVCYRSERTCIDLLTGQELPNNTTPSSTVSCFDSIFEDGTGETFTPEQVAGQTGFICREVLSGGEAVSGETEIDTLYTNRVCFDPISGDRLSPIEVQGELEIYQADALCYQPYQCKRIACFQGNQEVPSSFEGRPGVSCRATNELVSPDADVRKSCVQFNELITLQNIRNVNLCFDPFGNYIPVDSRIQSLEDYYINYAGVIDQSVQNLINSRGGIQCISPQGISERVCLTDSGQLVPGTREVFGGPPVPVLESEPGIAVCFEPLTSYSISEQLNGGGINQDIRETAAAIAQQLTNLAVLASGFGFFDNSVSDTLRDAADVFWQIAYADILENDIILAVAETTRQLEVLLNNIDPGAPNSEVVLRLREIIAYIKAALGLQNNVAWVTLGNDLPQGINIYASGLVTAQGGVNSGNGVNSGDGVDAQATIDSLDPVAAITAVQEGLVLLGLMDPLSVTGELDLVTQQALATLMAINGLDSLMVDGELDIQGFINSDGTLDIQGFLNSNGTLATDQVFISAEVLQLLQQMVNSSEGLYGSEESATINDFFSEPMGLGAYSQEVQNLQMLLYGEGYDISGFDGIYDEEVCLAVQQYQADNGLDLANPTDCQLSVATIESLNDTIRQGNYLGSGFAVGANGALEGSGVFLGTFGPGTVSFAVSEAEANSLREGDVVLMYTFLDEETILITRHESVITEIIKRRAFNDIFNVQ